MDYDPKIFKNPHTGFFSRAMKSGLCFFSAISKSWMASGSFRCMAA